MRSSNSRLLLLSATQPPEDIKQNISLQPMKALVQRHLAQLHLAETIVLVLHSKLLHTADCRQLHCLMSSKASCKVSESDLPRSWLWLPAANCIGPISSGVACMQANHTIRHCGFACCPVYAHDLMRKRMRKRQRKEVRKHFAPRKSCQESFWME